MVTTTKKAPRKKVKATVLTDNHKHRGKPCKRGDVIDVTEAQLARLSSDDRKTKVLAAA